MPWANRLHLDSPTRPSGVRKGVVTTNGAIAGVVGLVQGMLMGWKPHFMEILVKKILIACVMLVGVSVGTLEARPRLFRPQACQQVSQFQNCQPVQLQQNCQQVSQFQQVDSQFQQVSQQQLSYESGGLAQAHSGVQAALGRMFHSGRFVPGASYEGVGFSSSSPDEAIRNACYWGQRQPVQVGVQRGAGGWYATVQYR